jgi:hypothetical protein
MIPGVVASGRQAGSTLAAYEAAVLADSPRAFWPMQGNAAAAADNVITSLDLVWTGSPTFQEPGVRAGWESVRFNGSTQYGQTATIATTATELPLRSDTSYSMELWFRRNSGTALASLAAIRNTSANTEVFLLLHNTPAAGNARVWMNGGFKTAGAGALNDGAWHHRVDTWDGTTVRTYIDGSELQTGAYGVTSSNQTRFLIVAANNGGTPVQFFNGWISHPAAYDKVLTPTDVSDHYNASL